MKNLLPWLTLSLIYITACKDKNSFTGNNKNQKSTIALVGLDRNYEQQDTLAILDLTIPTRLDTFYQWNNNSDCINCGWTQYRFADSHYPIFAESGFFWLKTPDSTYSLTIRHKPLRLKGKEQKLRQIEERDSSLINSFSLQLSDRQYKMLKMEHRIINGYYFYLFYLQHSFGMITEKPTLYLLAVTNLHNSEIQFIAEHSGKDSVGFYQNMYESLLSIRINEKL